jgi:hypothetical protein
MTDKVPPEDEPGAEERFDRGIANALKMPPKRKTETSEEPEGVPTRAPSGYELVATAGVEVVVGEVGANL